MNVSIKHNGTTITSRVISYQREHKICSGIGTLTITIDGTYSTSIVPWDTIDIYENGDFKVRYYVSQVSKVAPDGTKTIECQDKSKRLVDYFIPDSYTVDYPSYTRYWIEKFLTDAGISYNFLTASQGNLLSNYTALGLQSGYDQIMMLLQLSGWYMFFDGNGVAVIGSLDVDFADVAAKYGKRDILNIKKVSNDKMLRNRAVVWGQYDPVRSEYAYADISKRTPWNYDSRDTRAIVVSNSNIPNKSSAYNIANILLKEFTKPTIEKHITLWGARNITLGDAVNVNTNIWRGKGLVTTFGVTMDRNGLVTNIILDERCPRLFGFFNFGDYVYVGTFGDGVWRKHIKFDPAWYNFSTGLTDLAITDLHINRDMFGAVGASGVPFYANSNEGPWNPITLSSFMSSEEDTASGVINYVAFSGLKARATIVDKTTNTVKFGIDTFSGLNTGDYFLTYSSFFGTTSSGIVTSSGVTTSGYRGWIAEYDPFTGELVGDLGSGIYPINSSGNYNLRVLDLENDGINDYVSIATTGITIPFTASGYDYGKSVTYQASETYDTRNITAYNLFDDFDQNGETLSGNAGTVIGFSVFNDESNGERRLVWTEIVAGVKRARELKISKVGGVITSTATISPTLPRDYVYIARQSIGVYKLYNVVSATPGAGNQYKGELRQTIWDTGSNTISSEVVLGTLTVPDNANKSSTFEFSSNATHMINGKIYHVAYVLARETAADLTNYMEFYMMSCDTETDSVISGLINKVDFETSEGGAGTHWTIFSLEGTLPFGKFYFQNGEFPSYAFVVQENNQKAGVDYRQRNYLVYSPYGGTFIKTLIQEAIGTGLSDFLYSPAASDETAVGAAQLTTDRFIMYYRSSNGTTYFYNGISVDIVNSGSIPFQWLPSKIYPIFGQHDTYYIAKNGSTWYWVEPVNCNLFSTITFPAGYTIVKPFNTSDYFSDLVYWQLTNTGTSQNEIHRFTVGGTDTGYSITPFGGFTFTQTRGLVAGNFFIDFSTSSMRWLYVDNQNPPIQGTVFQVLQRNGLNYSLIQESLKPIRIDISNNSPVLTVLDKENTFISNFVYGNEVTQVIPVSGLLNTDVRDYRYTLLETTSSGTVVASGAGVQTQIVYATGSGVFCSSADTYSGGFTLLSSIPSGLAERVETTNYTYPGQFIFVTTSGMLPTFYQRDNDSYIFVEYSGLPDSRATIVRCDDII